MFLSSPPMLGQHLATRNSGGFESNTILLCDGFSQHVTIDTLHPKETQESKATRNTTASSGPLLVAFVCRVRKARFS